MTDTNLPENNTEKQPKAGTGIKNILVSALAGLFGIQSEKNRARDFKEGKPADFILTGIIMVIVLILVMITIVNIVLSSAVK